jgi:hypothetical protein
MVMTKPLRPVDSNRELTVIEKDIQRLLKPKNISAEWDVD